MRIKCCLGCEPPKRHTSCHSTCSEYKEEKAVLEVRKEEVLKIREANADYNCYVKKMRFRNVQKARRKL